MKNQVTIPWLNRSASKFFTDWRTRRLVPTAQIRIRDIQGPGLVSPIANTNVTAVPGIVTAIAENGFYLQDPNSDKDPLTSEGIFVFTDRRDLSANGLDIRVGDSLQVSGFVNEFRPGGTGGTNNLTTTQISANRDSNTIARVGRGLALPAATIIGSGGRKPPTEIIYSDKVPFKDTGIGFYESLEGMLVKVQDAQSVAPTGNFSNNSAIWTVANRGADATGLNDRGGITISQNDFNPERIQITDRLLRFTFRNPTNGNPLVTIPQVNVGFGLGDVTGVVNYGFGNYEVLATQPIKATTAQLQREVTALKGTTDRLTVASYNVENLNPFEGVRFEVLAGQIVNNLKSPDVVALQEIQDNNGQIDDGTVSADMTYQFLIDAIASSGGPVYKFANIDPVNNRDGGQAGTNIRVGYLYNPARVSLNPGSLRRITDPNSTAANDGAFAASRKPLVATFKFNGQDVTVINNHLTARGGSDSLFGNVQPPNIGRDGQRLQQAQVINGEVKKILATNPNANLVMLGDLNGFDFEQYQQVLAGGVLTNLTRTLPVADRYTFNFQGNSQALDHTFVTKNLAPQAKHDIVHVNVDFVDQPADHEPLVTSLYLPPKQPKTFTLQILQTSDQEAGIPAFQDAIGFSAVMKKLDEKYENTLKLTTGDTYISSPFFNASRDIYDNATTGNPQADQGGIADMLLNNELGWDVASIGNHEFSGGASSFLNLVAPNPNWVNGKGGGQGIGPGGYRGAAFPFLANNLDYSRVNLPNGLKVVANGGAPKPNTLTGSVVKEIKGEKIGMIGVVTPYLRSIADTGAIGVTTRDANGNPITGASPVDVQVNSIIANITPEVQALTKAGINKIILMTHLQESRIEIALAQKIVDLKLGVDMVLGGGSHQVMSSSPNVPPLRDDETQQNNGQLLQPFPQIYGSGDNKVLFVNSAPNYRYVNQLVTTFDDKGVITSVGNDSGPYGTDISGVARVYNDSTIKTFDQVKAKADPDIVKIVDGVRGFVNKQDGTIFGQTKVFLNGIRGDVRSQETNLGNLVADSQEFYADAYLKQYNLLPGFNKIDISFLNGGSIRDVIGRFQVEQTNGGNLITLPPQANPEVGKKEGDVSQLDIANSLRFDGDLVVGTVNATGFLKIAEHMVSIVGGGSFAQIGGFNYSFDPTAPVGQRVRNLALADAQGNSVVAIVENGKLSVDPNTKFSVVTQGFLANGGDSYPTVLQNIVKLTDYKEPNSLGKANLRPGRVQDALAETLAASYNRDKNQAPFNGVDTPQSGDERVQNLSFRQDTVLDGIKPSFPSIIYGTPGDDVFDAAHPDSRGFVGIDQTLFTGSGNDTVDVSLAPGGNRIDTGSGDDLIFAGTNNRIIASTGNDTIFLGNGGGNNVVTGGTGIDRFWLVTDKEHLPTTVNTITDFNRGQGDVIGFANTNLGFGSVGLIQNGNDTIVRALNQDLARLLNVQASSLNSSAFVFA